jgi:hypothetical protein
MTDDNTELVTLSWINPITAELVEVDVTPHVAERIASGSSATWRGGPEPRRFSSADATARLRARIDQLDARMDELVNEHPGLKSLPGGRPRREHEDGP